MNLSISGFTIVRNAIKLNYPFAEAVRSILPICHEFIINCGDSEDDTVRLCEKLREEAPAKIKIIRSKWETKNQSGGFQLKEKTDCALAECKSPWCFYLQADEVIHENDYVKIAAAVRAAERRPEIDGILFDYLHFYGNYSYVIRGRNWYRREVRLFRNHKGISAYRDAQGFRKGEEKLLALRSGARVFHYGHVRSFDSFVEKRLHMSKWWGENPEEDKAKFLPKRPVGLKIFKSTHPYVMKKRIRSNENSLDPTQYPRKWDKQELKNLITLWWERIVPLRIGEFRNYSIARV